MTLTNSVDGDTILRGKLTVTGAVAVPASSFGNDEMTTADPIAVTKQDHLIVATYSVVDGADLAATTGDGFLIHTVHGTTATVLGIEAVCADCPEGGDKTFTVDLKKAGSGVAATTMLSAPIAFGTATTDYVALPGTLSLTALTNEQSLLVVVAVSGTTGNQGQGLVVTVRLTEDYA